MRAFTALEDVLVCGGQQVIGHAAGNRAAVPNHPAREAEHLERVRHPAHHPSVSRSQNVERGAGPFDQVLALACREADHVGNHRQGQGGGQVYPVDIAASDRGVDDLLRTTLHLIADGIQGSRQHPMRHQPSAPVVLGAVAGQGGAPGQSVAQRIQCHPAGGQECGVLAQSCLAFGVAR